MSRDLPARQTFLQHAANRREPFADARGVGVLEADERALLHRDRRDARAHESGAEHAELVHLARAVARVGSTPGSFFSALLAKNREDELARHVGHRHLAEQPRFLAQPVLEAARVSGLHGVERGERRRIVAVRLLHHAFARLLEHDAAAERIVARATNSSRPRLRRRDGLAACPSRERPRAIDRDLAQNRRMHHLVDETHLQRALRADAPAGENHVERGLQSDAPRQPLRAAHAGNQAELHLGQRERRSSDGRCTCDSDTRAPTSSPPPRQAP